MFTITLPKNNCALITVLTYNINYDFCVLSFDTVLCLPIIMKMYVDSSYRTSSPQWIKQHCATLHSLD